jgi:hypothetical protein
MTSLDSSNTKILKKTDFELDKDSNLLLKQNNKSIGGFNSVLFISQKCKFCGEMVDIQKSLSNVINGVMFSMMTVDSDDDDTTTKFLDTIQKSNIGMTYVPFLVFYVDHRPYFVYSGDPTFEDVKAFIIEVTTKYNNEKTFQTKKTSISPLSGNVKSIKNGCKVDDTDCMASATILKIKAGNNPTQKNKCYVSASNAYSNR